MIGRCVVGAIEQGQQAALSGNGIGMGASFNLRARPAAVSDVTVDIL
jgi:hypothetical protein